MSAAMTDHPAASFDAPGPEEALLGILLLDPTRIEAVVGTVGTAEFFAKEVNAILFACLLDLHERGRSGDLVELACLLRDRDVFTGAGGPKYLRELASGAPSPSTAVEFAKQIAERYRLRKIDHGG